MNLYINEQKVDSSLGEEKNLAQVFDQVSRWIESQGQYVVNCLLDGKETFRAELEDISVDSEVRIDFYSGKEIDILQSSIIELDRYLDTVGTTLFGRDSLTEKESRDLQEGTRWMSEILASAASILRLDYSLVFPVTGGPSLQQILNRLGELSSEEIDSLKGIEEYLDNLRNLKVFTIDLFNRLIPLGLDRLTVKNLVSAYASNMEVLKSEFIRVNENYQSGKDAVAAELLQHCTGKMHSLVTGLISLKASPDINFSQLQLDESAFEGMIENLNSTIREIANSLESGDIVQAGDLLEYELPEKLDGMVPFLHKIAENL